MSTRFYKILASTVALSTMISMLAACGSSNTSTGGTSSATADTAASSTAAKAQNPVKLEFYMPSPNSNPNDLQKVLDEFSKETKDTLNTTIHFNFATFDDIGNKVALKLAAGEQIDSAFSAQWTNPSLMQMVSKGQLVNLDKYFTDDNYPGLKKAFAQEFIKNNSFVDSKGESHVYGIPFTHSFDGGKVIYYRQDLAEKYGITAINSLDDLAKYYDTIVKNEKGVVPLSILGKQDAVSDIIFNASMPVTQKHNFEVEFAGMNGYGAIIKDDGTGYIARTANFRTDPEYQKYLPAEVKSVDPYMGYKVARDWYSKGYLEKDILSQKDNMSQFMAGKAASYNSTLDVYADRKQQLEKSIPGAKLGYFIIDSSLRAGTPKAFGSTMQAWNFACIPVTSKNADRTMQFFNWLFADQKNHDLFEFGIEGTHWTANGTTKYSIPAGLDASKSYNFPGFTLTWNPTMIRYSDSTPDNVVKVMNELGDTSFLYKKISAGFSFVSDSVKSEQAKVNDLQSYRIAVGNGTIADIPGYFADLQKKYDQAGYQKYVGEMEKQFNAFLKTHPYQGQ